MGRETGARGAVEVGVVVTLGAEAREVGLDGEKREVEEGLVPVELRVWMRKGGDEVRGRFAPSWTTPGAVEDADCLTGLRRPAFSAMGGLAPLWTMPEAIEDADCLSELYSPAFSAG